MTSPYAPRRSVPGAGLLAGSPSAAIFLNSNTAGGSQPRRTKRPASAAATRSVSATRDVAVAIPASTSKNTVRRTAEDLDLVGMDLVEVYRKANNELRRQIQSMEMQRERVLQFEAEIAKRDDTIRNLTEQLSFSGGALTAGGGGAGGGEGGKNDTPEVRALKERLRRIQQRRAEEREVIRALQDQLARAASGGNGGQGMGGGDGMSGSAAAAAVGAAGEQIKELERRLAVLSRSKDTDLAKFKRELTEKDREINAQKKEIEELREELKKRDNALRANNITIKEADRKVKDAKQRMAEERQRAKAAEAALSTTGANVTQDYGAPPSYPGNSPMKNPPPASSVGNYGNNSSSSNSNGDYSVNGGAPGWGQAPGYGANGGNGPIVVPNAYAQTASPAGSPQKPGKGGQQQSLQSKQHQNQNQNQQKHGGGGGGGGGLGGFSALAASNAAAANHDEEYLLQKELGTKKSGGDAALVSGGVLGGAGLGGAAGGAAGIGSSQVDRWDEDELILMQENVKKIGFSEAMAYRPGAYDDGDANDQPRDYLRDELAYSRPKKSGYGSTPQAMSPGPGGAAALAQQNVNIRIPAASLLKDVDDLISHRSASELLRQEAW